MVRLAACAPAACCRPFQRGLPHGRLLRLHRRCYHRHQLSQLHCASHSLQGCICCTVRGDLIRILNKLLKVGTLTCEMW